jgi:hypothetical protein
VNVGIEWPKQREAARQLRHKEKPDVFRFASREGFVIRTPLLKLSFGSVPW